MDATDINEIADLEDENRRIKQIYAYLSLECRALKGGIEKALYPSIKRELGNYH